MILLRQAKARIFADVINGKVFKGGGLNPHEEDSRDLQLGIFGLGEYKPRFDYLRVPTMQIKDQAPFNTCAWNAVTTQKEVDEKCVLSVQKLVEKGLQLNLLSGDGFSSLRDNQDIVRKFGIPEDKYSIARTYNWGEYSKYRWTPEIEANAQLHRTASYWTTRAKNDLLKLLDEGKVFQTGMEWYTSMNASGGFGSNGVYIMDKRKGSLIGGHSFVLVGYEKNYKGYGLCLRFQNSFSHLWGDKGDFYVPIDLAIDWCYTFYAQLDIEVDIGRWLTKYEGKFVKAKDEMIGGQVVRHPAIYRIKEGKKEAFENMIAYFAFEGERKGYEMVDQKDLVEVPDGTILDLPASPHYQMIKNITENIPELIKVVREAAEFDAFFKANNS